MNGEVITDWKIPGGLPGGGEGSRVFQHQGQLVKDGSKARAPNLLNAPQLCYSGIFCTTDGTQFRLAQHAEGIDWFE